MHVKYPALLTEEYLKCSDSDTVHLLDYKKADSAGIKILNNQNMIIENQYVYIDNVQYLVPVQCKQLSSTFTFINDGIKLNQNIFYKDKNNFSSFRK